MRNDPGEVRGAGGGAIGVFSNLETCAVCFDVPSNTVSSLIVVCCYTDRLYPLLVPIVSEQIKKNYFLPRICLPTGIKIRFVCNKDRLSVVRGRYSIEIHTVPLES